ncbi:phosphoribosylamine--glycine ligase [Psychrobacter sp. FDAARGOS_221]|uniref:phosphoribosylamine--glycine ligase n=1 Tax=Psychrobacter sp. FDAARGOS_221 TaxID=1975705 RepID=UPI000BB58BE6|nr:phosphoribosylamine--glycine ligase [Psychrobacter sp. FDAARGOS_221]PNK59738.1 phosphoribosylamine--glycine ligase [Psychrobacter sp. FDAARGOS_221]
MNILVIGSGGREHALAWQCAKDADVATVYVANGNAGTALEPKCENIDLDTNNHDAVIDFCQQNKVELVIVGPEAPLVAGLVDDCRNAGIAIWGPTQYCAQLEGSKTFAKEFMQANNIPTAHYAGFTEIEPAKEYVNQHGAPIVVKADGLAAGKGVIVAETVEQAHEAIEDMLGDNKFGDAGSRVVIEQFLQGEEASFICMIDGDNILPMATSQDHKRVGEGDTGPNTGGMGAYSPAPVVTDEVHQKVMSRVIEPVVQAMKAAGHPYTGFLYAGLMIDDNNDPYVIEFNCRFGDPETQPIMMRLQSSLVKLVQQGVEGNLPAQADWDTRAALGIVLASKGYPESSSKGDMITGLPELGSDQSTIKVFHAGTKKDGEHVVTNGGRVLCVTALGDDIAQAQQAALQATAAIEFDGAHYRRDIGYRALNRG